MGWASAARRRLAADAGLRPQDGPHRHLVGARSQADPHLHRCHDRHCHHIVRPLAKIGPTVVSADKTTTPGVEPQRPLRGPASSSTPRPGHLRFTCSARSARIGVVSALPPSSPSCSDFFGHHGDDDGDRGRRVCSTAEARCRTARMIPVVDFDCRCCRMALGVLVQHSYIGLVLRRSPDRLCLGGHRFRRWFAPLPPRTRPRSPPWCSFASLMMQQVTDIDW